MSVQDHHGKNPANEDEFLAASEKNVLASLNFGFLS